MLFIATSLIYAAVLVRTADWFNENPPIQGLVFVLLAVYGAIMVSEPLFTRRFHRYPFLYLPAQTGLGLGLMIAAPGMDFAPMLFLPLSFQTVQFLGPKRGFLWIGAFSLAVAGPLLIGWEWEVAGLASVLLFSGLGFAMGSNAHQAERARLARQENQRLLGETERAYHQLQAYAAQMEEVAAAQERSRLARELHDSVTQTLFSMNLTVQAAQMLAVKEPGKVAAQLDRLQELAHAAIGEIQVLVRQYRPHPAAGTGLVEALRRLSEERRQRDGLQIQLAVSGAGREKDLPEQVTTGLYRIAQEALNNVSKHAGVCDAVLRLDLEVQPAYLEIEDHGAGFAPAQAGPPGRSLSHLGLAGMAERAREMGWKMRIDSQPGRGTRVRVEEDLHA
jgi:signal transduction histidine kinase